MKIVTIHEAKTHLSRLIQDALAGEDIVIAKGKDPVVRLVVHETHQLTRSPGAMPGLIVSMADDFDAPLADFQPHMQ